jgi:GT2 family glycosyltransferase
VNRSPVSVVVPALDDRDLLERSLPPLQSSLSPADEVIVVDDTGALTLEPWIAERFARSSTTAATTAVRCLTRVENGGFARAARSGVEAAAHPLVLLLNPDVIVRPGFLEPLVHAIGAPGEAADVFAVSPRVLLFGQASHVETLTALSWRDGDLEIREHGERAVDPVPPEPAPIAFALGGAMLVRRAAFLALGGFDPLFEPFYYEDTDLSWRARRAGLRVLLAPDSVVEHHHRGTLGRAVPPAVVAAAIERNRLLLVWKHVTGEERIEEHLDRLAARVVDAALAGRADTLCGLALALEDAHVLLRSRASLPGGPTSADPRLFDAQD